MYWLPYSSHTSHHHSQSPYFPWLFYVTKKFMLDSCKLVGKQSIPDVSVAFFQSLKQNFITYLSSKVSSRLDRIFEIHQLWQSGSSRVYSNSSCSCLFEHEKIKICQSSHKMYSNNIQNFQVSTKILNACTKKSGNWLNAPYIYIYIYIYWLTVVESNLKDPFLIFTAPKCRTGCNSFPGLLHFLLFRTLVCWVLS